MVCRLSVLLLLLVAQTAFGSEPKMVAHFIDVGQGDATLLEFPCGAALIDTGAENRHYVKGLVEYLEKFFNDRPHLNSTLDVVFITHTHRDHTRGLRAIAQHETLKIANYVDSGVREAGGASDVLWVIEHAVERGITTLGVTDDMITNLPSKTGFTNDIVDPIDGEECDPVLRILQGGMQEWHKFNDTSLVIRVDFGEASFLFTGDLEYDGQRMLGGWYKDTDMLDTDIYQVGHHGSPNGSSMAFVRAVDPKIAVISAGQSSSALARQYGHPRKSVVDLLSDEISGVRSNPVFKTVFTTPYHPTTMEVRKHIYATCWDGNIQVSAWPDGRTRTHIDNPSSPYISDGPSVINRFNNLDIFNSDAVETGVENSAEDVRVISLLAEALVETAKTRQAPSNGDVVPAMSPAHCGRQWTTVEIVLSVAVLAFGLLCLLIQTYLALAIRKGWNAASTLRMVGVTLLTCGSLVLVTAGYSVEQISPVIGLFGSLAGYLLGTTPKPTTEATEDGTVSNRLRRKTGSETPENPSKGSK